MSTTPPATAPTTGAVGNDEELLLAEDAMLAVGTAVELALAGAAVLVEDVLCEFESVALAILR